MTTKHEIRRRTNNAVKLLLLGHSTQSVVGKVAERERCSRRTARRVVARAWKVVRDDVDKVGLENPEMASLLIHQLQEIAAQVDRFLAHHLDRSTAAHVLTVTQSLGPLQRQREVEAYALQSQSGMVESLLARHC